MILTQRMLALSYGSVTFTSGASGLKVLKNQRLWVFYEDRRVRWSGIF